MFGESILTYLIANLVSIGAFIALGMLIFRQNRWRGIMLGLFLGFTIGPMLVDAALVDPAPKPGERRAISPIKLR